MPLAERLIIALLPAAAIVYAVTPFAIRLAERLQFYDQPTGYKGHLKPTPYLGGAAVMAGFLIALLISADDWDRTTPLACSVLLLWAVGTIDDRRGLSPWLRLWVELCLGVIVWATGLGWHLHAGGLVDLILSCAWVVGVVNAFNLFDNMDGAASTMALVVVAATALIGVARGDVWLATAGTALSGACLGFLPRNLSTPARIFLGDGGSMPLGFAVAVLVMVAAGTSTVAWHSLLVALLLIGVPALDTCLVIISRRRRGVSILSGGRDHLTHRAHAFLRSERLVALSLGALQAAVSVVAVLASQGEATLVVISASLYMLLAAGAIIVLDAQSVESFTPPGTGAAGARFVVGRRAVSILIAIGLGAGVSPFFFTYYDASVWVPLGLAFTLLCAITFVMRPVHPGGPAALSLFGLLGLGIWSLCSSTWAESVENAIVSGNRWLFYGALLVFLTVLVTNERRAALLLAATTLGVCVVAASVLARLLGGDPGSLFVNARLNSPLGYINGEGCLFAMGIWPCLAMAGLRRALLAGAGAGAATLMACLALLSQSRGTALAVAGPLILVIAFVPGRTRRVYAALLVAGGVALAGADLLHVYNGAAGGMVSKQAAHAAGRAALLAALSVSAVWGLLTAAWESLTTVPKRREDARALGAWLLAVPATIILVLGLGATPNIEREARAQWHAFVRVAEPGENTAPSAAGESHSRLLSGAGNRYDYWRIAWKVWKQHPLAGIGAGNYPRLYFERRATTEDVQQPHSLALQVLCELGLLGALLLACFIAGVGWGARRMHSAARSSALQQALMTGALGSFGAWLVQGSVDWMHLLPGLTGIAIASAAVLVRAPGASAARRERVRGRLAAALTRRPVLALGVSAVFLTLLVAGASLTRQGLAQVFRNRAQGELAANPTLALRDANRSLYIDADSSQSYYIKAAALARFDRARDAETALAGALIREPRNFVTWTLLGDVSLRQRKLDVATRYYARAHELNPRNAIVRELALNPGAAPH